MILFTPIQMNPEIKNTQLPTSSPHPQQPSHQFHHIITRRHYHEHTHPILYNREEETTSSPTPTTHISSGFAFVAPCDNILSTRYDTRNTQSLPSVISNTMPPFAKLLTKFRSKPILAESEHNNKEAAAAEQRKHFAKYTIPVALLAVYILCPIMCIILAGVNLNHHDLDYKYYLSVLQAQHMEQQALQQAAVVQNQTIVGSVLSTLFTVLGSSQAHAEQQQQAQQKVLEATVRDAMCSKPLSLWLIIAGIAFLLNVPMVYLYQIHMKILKKREKKGIFVKLKNQITSGTKKGVIGLIGLMAVVVQPFNFAWSIIGLVWVWQTTSNEFCSTTLYVLSFLKSVIIFVSVFGHMYLLFSIVKQLKKSKLRSSSSSNDGVVDNENKKK